MDKNQIMKLPDPQIFAIETILGCDLKCPECAVGGDFITRNKKSMSFENFKIIADKIRPYCQYLYLHIWGEPILNKNIFKMIEYAAPFTKTNISTNGQSVSEEKAVLLIKSGVSDIIVSIDGLTQQVYEKYRVGGNLNKATSTLKMLQHFNMKYGKKVNITPQFIVMKHNYHEIESFKQFCGSLGLTPLFKAPYIRHVQSQFSFSDDKRFQRPSYPDIHSLKAGMCGCKSVQNVFNILLDGSVVACCHDYDKFTFFGNIFNKNVRQIWNSEKFRNFRWSVMSGNAPIFCIEKCMTYILSHSKQKLSENVHMQKSKNANNLKINLCSGSRKLFGYINIDLQPGSDIIIDLEHKLLPFPDNSASVIVCISAINYFSKQRALEIIRDVYRVLMPGGITRFATQDLRILVEKYLQNDSDFFFQKLSDGKERFPGISFGDKLNNFFCGFQANNKTCKFVYDYETLSSLFKEANFCSIKQKKYHESDIPEVAKIDNRPEQMFFLEAHKKKSNSLDLIKISISSNHYLDKNKQNEESTT
ncbi:radical SAM protein, partial [Candidatus Magnetomorum sp. HK-1]